MSKSITTVKATSHPKDRVDPFNAATWSESERDYFNSVARVFRDREDMLVSNAQPAHVAYLVKLLIVNAERKLRLVSGGLPLTLQGTKIFGSYDIVAAVMEFLSRSDTVFQILVHGDLEGVVDISDHPNVWATENLRARNQLRGILKIQQLSNSWEQIMRDNEMLWHWMTMDESAYRLESDIKKRAAIANFGEPDYARDLAAAFDAIASDDKSNKVIALVKPDSPE